MNKTLLLKKIRAVKAEQRKILAGCKDDKGEIREMTKEECERFDALETKVGGLEETLSRVADLDDDDERDEEEEGEEEVEAASKRSSQSGRRSDADQFGGQSPAIRTRKKPYSVLRALRFAAQGKAPDGLEGEISQEIRRRNKGKEWSGQFSMPMDPDPELRALMYPNAQRRDLTSSTGAGGIFTVPELPMIELLRPRMMSHRLGCTILTGMQGLFAIPRQSGNSTGNWIGEGSSATPSNATLDQVPFSPKVYVNLSNISRQFINQTSVAAETFAMNDLAKSTAVAWDYVTFNGAGSGSNQPLGIFQNSAIQTLSDNLAIGTNGGALAWGNLVNMETQVANANADQGTLKYLTCPAIRGTLKQTPKVTSSTFPIFIWEDGAGPGEGVINSYPALATTNVPSNGTKGSGTNLGSVAFGNWEDLVLASWDDGVDFLVNPYSNQASAAVTISMEISVDSEVRHNQSFAIITDATFDEF